MNKFLWDRLGIVWNADGRQMHCMSHAMVPTPYLIDRDTIRVIVNCLDQFGRSRPYFVDVLASDPTRIIGLSTAPLIDVGIPGTFDENGVVATSVLTLANKRLLMFYAGFELCTNIRYRIFTGIACSDDGGLTFQRHSQAPVLDRVDGELHFRCGPFAMQDGDTYKLWYVAGSDWTKVDGKDMPVYELRYMESSDPLVWSGNSKVALKLTDEDEHGFGRPWVSQSINGDYELFYSVRRRSHGAYRLGYARSSDGIHWTRYDSAMGLDVRSDMFDSNAIMYSAVLSTEYGRYCFYNGNDFGVDGFAVAKLVE